jgi:hypothetical protein
MFEGRARSLTGAPLRQVVTLFASFKLDSEDPPGGKYSSLFGEFVSRREKSFIILAAVQRNELSAWKQRLWNNHPNKILEHKGNFKNLPKIILGLITVQSVWASLLNDHD